MIVYMVCTLSYYQDEVADNVAFTKREDAMAHRLTDIQYSWCETEDQRDDVQPIIEVEIK